MSIVAYTGLPGAGKSYGVVEHVIVPALQSGRRVVTNVAMRADVVASRGWPGTLEQVTSEQVAGDGWFDSLPGGAVVVLDELWRLWPAGLKTVNVPMSHKSFLAEHRHRVGPDGYTTEIAIITQDLGQVAAFVRQLVEQTVRVVKMSAVGAEKRFRVDFYRGAQTGQNPPESALLRQTFGEYRAAVWDLYRTHTQADGGATGTEQRVDRRGSALRSWSVRVGLPVGVLVAILGIVWAVRTLGSPGPDTQPAAPVVQARPAPRQQAATHPPAPAQASPSAGRAAPLVGWRVGGWVEAPGRTGSRWVVLVSDAGYVRTVRAADLDCRELSGSVAGLDVGCHVDGQDVTPWSGAAAARSLGWQGGDGSVPSAPAPAPSPVIHPPVARRPSPMVIGSSGGLGADVLRADGPGTVSPVVHRQQ